MPIKMQYTLMSEIVSLLTEVALLQFKSQHTTTPSYPTMPLACINFITLYQATFSIGLQHVKSTASILAFCYHFCFILLFSFCLSLLSLFSLLLFVNITILLLIPVSNVVSQASFC